MSDKKTDSLRSRLDALAQTQPEDGSKVWSARKLLSATGYTRPEHFMIAIRRAAAACLAAGETTAVHFRPVTLVKPAGENAVQVVRDFKLSRFACHLLVNTGFSRRKSVGFARDYFAPKTAKPVADVRVKKTPVKTSTRAKPAKKAPAGPNSWKEALETRSRRKPRNISVYIPHPEDGKERANWDENRKALWNPNLAVNRGYHNGAASNSR